MWNEWTGTGVKDPKNSSYWVLDIISTWTSTEVIQVEGGLGWRGKM